MPTPSGTARTQLALSGYGTRRYGSFADKAVVSNVGLEGIEYAATGEPLHYAAPYTPMEYAAVVNRLHFEAREGDT